LLFGLPIGIIRQPYITQALPPDAIKKITSSKSLNWIFGTPDAREGIASYPEKRQPAFPMKLSKDLPPFYP